MRIRKSTKLLSPGFYGVDSPETLVCRLNQSPWDVISFGSADGNNQDASWFLPSSSSSSTAYRFQFDGEDSFNGNASLGDFGGVESVASEKLELMFLDETEKLGNEATDHLVPRIQNKTTYDRDSSASLKSSSVKRSADSPSSDPAASMPPRRGRPPGSVKKPPSAPPTTTASSPHEFYYYSGFGPRWGKRRGGAGEGSRSGADNNGDTDNWNNEGINGNRAGKTLTFYDSDSDDELSYMYDEDDEEDDDEEDEEMYGRKINGKMKKRGRKPVKARSLKSLM